jgi:SEFIR domain
MRGEEQLRERRLGKLSSELTYPFKSNIISSYAMAPSPSRAFISYSHDSTEHEELVLRFARRLRKDGVDAQIDQFVGGRPTEGWPRWMLDKLDWAEFVLLICTETYYRRFRGHEVLDRGRGVDWEGQLITLEIYNAKSRSTKFVPVIFGSKDKRFIPEPLSDHVYCLDSEKNYQELYGFLTGQAGVPLPELGPAKQILRKDVEPLTFAGQGDKSSSTGKLDEVPGRLPRVVRELLKNLEKVVRECKKFVLASLKDKRTRWLGGSAIVLAFLIALIVANVPRPKPPLPPSPTPSATTTVSSSPATSEPRSLRRQETSVAGLVAELVRFGYTENFITAEVTFRNEGSESAIFCFGTWRLIDEQTTDKWGSDAVGGSINCYQKKTLAPGTTHVAWAKFKSDHFSAHKYTLDIEGILKRPFEALELKSQQ